jgi:hypothetical protein
MGNGNNNKNQGNKQQQAKKEAELKAQQEAEAKKQEEQKKAQQESNQPKEETSTPEVKEVKEESPKQENGDKDKGGDKPVDGSDKSNDIKVETSAPVGEKELALLVKQAVVAKDNGPEDVNSKLYSFIKGLSMVYGSIVQKDDIINFAKGSKEFKEGGMFTSEVVGRAVFHWGYDVDTKDALTTTLALLEHIAKGTQDRINEKATLASYRGQYLQFGSRLVFDLLNK